MSAEVHHLAVAAARILGVHHHKEENKHGRNDQQGKYGGEKQTLPFNVLHGRFIAMLPGEGLHFPDIRGIQFPDHIPEHHPGISGGSFPVGDYDHFPHHAAVQILNELRLGVIIFLSSQQRDHRQHDQQKRNQYKIRTEISAMLFQWMPPNSFPFQTLPPQYRADSDNAGHSPGRIPPQTHPVSENRCSPHARPPPCVPAYPEGYRDAGIWVPGPAASPAGNSMSGPNPRYPPPPAHPCP